MRRWFASNTHNYSCSVPRLHCFYLISLQRAQSWTNVAYVPTLSSQSSFSTLITNMTSKSDLRASMRIFACASYGTADLRFPTSLPLLWHRNGTSPLRFCTWVDPPSALYELQVLPLLLNVGAQQNTKRRFSVELHSQLWKPLKTTWPDGLVNKKNSELSM